MARKRGFPLRGSHIKKKKKKKKKGKQKGKNGIGPRMKNGHTNHKPN